MNECGDPSHRRMENEAAFNRIETQPTWEDSFLFFFFNMAENVYKDQTSHSWGGPSEAEGKK